MLTNPLISVIVLTFNSSNFVIETMESIKHQTYKNIELIISDDGSRDNTIAIVEEWLKDNKGFFVRCIVSTSTYNTGIPRNCNRGIVLASGDWIKIIAGDDCLFSYTLAAYIKFAGNNPEVNIIHSDVAQYRSSFAEENRLHDTLARNFRINREGITPDEQFQILLRVNRIWAPTVMIKSSTLQAVGLFDESHFLWEDRPMWLKMTRAGIKLQYLDILGVKYRTYKDSVSRKKTNRIFSKHLVEVHKGLLENYFRYLPFKEKLLKVFLARHMLVVDALKIPNVLVFRVLVKTMRYPFNRYKQKIDNGYI
jgi:glycosyltransferase involved in cell wall biosynthesis